MRIKYLLIVLIVSGCASLQTPQETNIAVSALLDEIQIAINEIDKRIADNDSLPPFKNAVVKLSTKASITTGGSASLVLSGEKSQTSTDSNIITLVLVPNPDLSAQLVKSTGHNIADYVIAAVSAVDDKNFLKLNSLTVEAGLQVLQKSGGGIEVELVGVTLEGGRTSESTKSHSLKLVFEQPKSNK